MPIARALKRAFPHGPLGRELSRGKLRLFPTITLPKRHPVLFGAALAGVKTGLADYGVQRWIEGKESKDINWRRVSAFTMFGVTYLGYVCYMFYVPLLTRVLFPKSSEFITKPLIQKLRDVQGLKDAVKQAGTDVFIHAPFFYYPTFYVMKEYVMTEGNPAEHEHWLKNGLDKHQNNFKDDMLGYMAIWGPAQVCNFVLMPAWGRIPFIAGVSLGWTMLLSYMRGGEENIDVNVQSSGDVDFDVENMVTITMVDVKVKVEKLAELSIEELCIDKHHQHQQPNVILAMSSAVSGGIRSTCTLEQTNVLSSSTLPSATCATASTTSCKINK